MTVRRPLLSINIHVHISHAQKEQFFKVAVFHRFHSRPVLESCIFSWRLASGQLWKVLLCEPFSRCYILIDGIAVVMPTDTQIKERGKKQQEKVQAELKLWHFKYFNIDCSVSVQATKLATRHDHIQTNIWFRREFFKFFNWKFLFFVWWKTCICLKIMTVTWISIF